MSASDIDARRLAAIVDSSDDAIVGKDLNGIVTSWNRAAERIFGYTAKEMIGCSILRIIPFDRRGEEDEVLGHIRRGVPVEHFETIRQRKDGSLIPISLTVSPIRDATGTVIGASKIARDITDRKKAEAEAERAYEQVEAASRMKDEFLATLSHELRTPLNAVLGYARMLQSGVVPQDKVPQALEVVERNATSLTRIVEDVLDVSRIISGKVRLKMQAVTLSTVIADAIATVEPAADAKGVVIETVEGRAVGAVSGDPSRLQQVLWNLLSNAVKFTPGGGRIEVRLASVDSHVEVIVSDTGMGIRPDFLPHIFERFRQAESGTTRQHGGLGLGLAIARHIVEMHGGTIEASSGGQGKGSTFRVVLPSLSAHVHLSAEERAEPPATSARTAPLMPELAGCHVLAVDDDADALNLVRQVLEAAGATVTAALSGEQALAALAATRPDAIVTDLAMPHMDGFDLINRVRNLDDPKLREIPAAILTAYARPEDRAKALRSGFGMHLSKPVDPAELVAAVAVLARHRARA